MNHDEAAKLLRAYQDGELDLTACVKVEEHLARCAECQRQLAGEQELVGLLQVELPRFKPSPFLETRIRAQLRAAEPVPWWRSLRLSWVAGAAAVLMLGVASYDLSVGREPLLVHEAVANHVRSLQVNHLFDVASSDQHTVKPWFAGKIDFSPQVVDLGPSGYPLVGGRLDVLDRVNVAAMIYQRRKHYINLFVWPAERESLSDRMDMENGYHVLSWSKGGMNYVAVSELGERELKEFARMIREQTVDARTGE